MSRDLNRKQVYRDHVFDKPFLRSVKPETAATHQTRLEFFAQEIEKRQEKIASIFIFFVDTNLPTKEVYSYDRRYKEAR